MPVGDSPRDVGTGDTATIIPDQHALDTTGVLDNLMAGYKAARAGPSDTNSHNNAYAKPYYDYIIDELSKRGFQGGDDVTDPFGKVTRVARPFSNPLGITLDPRHNSLEWGNSEQQAIWDAVKQARAKDPSFLKDLPDQAALHERIVRDRQRDYAQASDVTNRAGIPGHVAAFIGQMAGSWDDPANFLPGFGIAGGAGKITARTVLKGALEEAAVNAAGATLALPGTVQDAKNLGIDMTPGDMAEQVGEAAAFGAAAHGVKVAVPRLLEAGGKVASRAFDASIEHLPESVKTAAAAAALRAGTVPDRALIAEVTRAHTPFTVNSTASPSETAAIHTVTQDADLREASPFHPVGDPANENRLAGVMDELGVKASPPAVPSPAPLPASHPARGTPTTGYGDAVLKAEGYSAEPKAGSTISGYGQFSERTWLSVYKSHFGGQGMTDAQILALRHDRDAGRQMIEAYGEDNGKYLRSRGLEDSAGNRSLAHFLGPADAANVLRAEPSAPIERVIAPAAYRANEKLLQGKSASEVIAWAHKRIGEASGEPVARADAVPDFEDYGGDTTVVLPPTEHRTFSPSELTTDAARMQYKSGGNQAGVTDRLSGVQEWNPLLSGKVVVWEGNDGRFVVADGHQRLGLAQRLAASDPNIKLDGILIRESDGVSAQMARVIAALKNIEEGSGTAIDAARVLRDAPDGARLLSPNAPNRRMAEGLVGLSNDAFGAVLNDVIDPRIAAQIGNLAASQPASHMALIKLLKDAGVNTPDLAATVVKQALNDGFSSQGSQQLGLFGDEPAHALYGSAARVLDAARRQLRDEKRSFKTLTQDATRIEGAGNKLDRQANQAKVIDNETALAILDATAHRSGPVRDALLAAAREHIAGNRGAAKQFVDALGGIDLQAAAGGLAEGASHGLGVEPGGHPFDGSQTDAKLAEGRGLPGGPTAYDEAVAAGQSSLGFSEPIGPDAEAQTAAVEHDLQMELAPEGDKPPSDATFRLGEEGGEQSYPDLMAQLDADIAAVEALKGCL